MNGKRHIGKLLISIGLILIFISSYTRYIPEFKYLTDYLFLIHVLFILSYSLNLFLMLTEITTKRLIINTFVISSIVVFSYFLINYPIAESTGAYKGGFGNPNSIGVLAVTLFSVSLVAGTSLLKNKRSYILAS